VHIVATAGRRGRRFIRSSDRTCIAHRSDVGRRRSDVWYMKKLNELSRECVNCKAMCCGKRTPPFLCLSEVAYFLDKQCPQNKIIEKGSCHCVKGLCHFLDRSDFLCKIYKNRPIDCRTYPVFIGIKNQKIVYFIDQKCPVVKNKLITKKYIDSAIGLWRKNMPSFEWIRDYQNGDAAKNYDFVLVEDYLRWLQNRCHAEHMRCLYKE